MSEQEKRETVQEAKILEALKHPNIVQFIEVFKTKKGKLCIVMDYADGIILFNLSIGGDIQDRIKQQKGRYFSESQILEWFTQLCLGMKHIHDRKILHRDLKGQNIFLTKQGIVKIGDFGIAKVLNHTMQNAKTVVGTPYYLSPEIVQSKPYNFKSDIWSLGVCLYELCALKPPFDAPSLHFLAMKIVRGAYNPVPSQYSQELKSLISSCLNINEKMRPDVNKILTLPIIQKGIKTFLTETIYQKEFSHTILHKQNVFQANQANQNNPQYQQQQLQNLQQQIKLAKQGVAPGQPPPTNIPQNIPRYQPNNPPPQPKSYQPANPVPSRPAQVQPPPYQAPQRVQSNRNQVSPGMAAIFGGYGGAGAQNQQQKPQQKPTSQEPPKYGAAAVGYQPTNQQKPNYHYQQKQQQQEPKPTPDIQQQIKESQEKIRRMEEEKAQKERMMEIDRRLREKEAQLKALEREKEKRVQTERQQEERRKQDDKMKQLEAQEIQKRKMQEEQSKKIQDTQLKRKEEIEKMRQDNEKRKRDEQRKLEQRKLQEEEKKRQQQKMEQLKQEKRQEQQQNFGHENTLDFIKQAALGVQNQISNIENKVVNNKQEGGLMMNYEPPRAVKEKHVQQQVKSAKREEVKVVEPPKIQKQKSRDEITDNIKSKQAQMKSQRDRSEERKLMMKELRQKGLKEKNSKKDGFIELVGIEDSQIKNQPEVQPKRTPQTEKQKDRKSEVIIPQKKEPVVKKVEEKKVEENKKVQRESPFKLDKKESRDRSKSPAFGGGNRSQSPYEDKKSDKNSNNGEFNWIPEAQEQYNEQQMDEIGMNFERKYSQELLNEYREVYDMYDEMLSLVKENYNQESNEQEEVKEEVVSPSKKEEKDLSDNEGFNDERDENWDGVSPGKQKEDNAKALDSQVKRDNRKKRFDETLSTVQECEEPEGTFQNTIQHRLGAGPGIENVNSQDVEDRDDDFDDDDDTTQASERKNQLKDFTFANGDQGKFDDDLSKFSNVEEVRFYLEGELGEEKILKCHPILYSFGDKLLFEENIGEVEQSLKGILTKEEVCKYIRYFTTWIITELEAEKNGNGFGMMNAMKSFKGINTGATATFGQIF